MRPLPYLTVCFIFFNFIVCNAQTYVSGYIDEETVWDTVGSPYIITDSLIVNDILYIKSGTVVLFKYHPEPDKKSYMVINGAIDIYVVVGKPVVFTSERDNSLGDIKGVSKTTIPKPGDWGYIKADESIFNECYIHGVEFRYGGGRNPDTVESEEYYPMLILNGNTKNARENCLIEHSKGVGLRLGSLEYIDNFTISDCQHGIEITKSDVNLYNVTVKNCKKYPLFFKNLQLNYRDEIASFIGRGSSNMNFENNGQNYFAIGGNITLNRATENYEECHWNKMPIPYLITNPLKFYDQNVVIENGTLNKFIEVSS